MGVIETSHKRRMRRGEIERAVLSVTAVSGLLAVAIVAPNAARLLKYIPQDKYKFGHYTRHTLTRLVKKGLITYEERNGKKFARLTSSGEQALAKQRFEFGSTKQMKRKWDKKWRMILFDIPERRRKTRNRLRHYMEEVGFLRLQDSVWIYPYDCEDLVDLLKAELRVGSDVVYAIVDRFQNENSIREHFSLPLE